MKALVKKHSKEGLWLEEVPIPSYGDNDLLVKIQKTSICGTDVHLYKWDAWAQKTLPVPSIIGHEFLGIVTAVGKNVTGFHVGQRVSGEGHITCGQCLACRTGQRVLCPQTQGIGVNRHGCFAEYLALPAENAFIVPHDIPDNVAAIFDPLGNAIHTALSFDLVGKDVLITGAGPIGLMAIRVAQKAGARRVVITDLNPYRLRKATEMGAWAVVNIATQNLTDLLTEWGMPEGFDVSLEMSGNAAAFASLAHFTRHGGAIALLGILPETALIDWHKVIFKMLTIKGIYGREIFRTWYQMTHMIQSGLDITPVLTHHFPMEEFQKGFDVMLSGECGKVVLDWTHL